MHVSTKNKFPDDPSSSIYWLCNILNYWAIKTEKILRRELCCWGRWLEKCIQECMDGLRLLSGSQEDEGNLRKNRDPFLLALSLVAFWPRSGCVDPWICFDVELRNRWSGSFPCAAGRELKPCCWQGLWYLVFSFHFSTFLVLCVCKYFVAVSLIEIDGGSPFRQKKIKNI
jgi:hypothetical protein